MLKYGLLVRESGLPALDDRETMDQLEISNPEIVRLLPGDPSTSAAINDLLASVSYELRLAAQNAGGWYFPPPPPFSHMSHTRFSHISRINSPFLGARGASQSSR